MSNVENLIRQLRTDTLKQLDLIPSNRRAEIYKAEEKIREAILWLEEFRRREKGEIG